MKTFIHDDFLLMNDVARQLYHECAAGLPIIDYHNHLKVQDLADNRIFENLTQLWVAGDPYKHRAMRIAGVPERLITGEATEREKFEAWAATVPLTLGNPLFHWTALELQRFFGISELLTPESAGRIWHQCNERLQTPQFGARQLVARSRVECLCTSDKWDDDLQAHARLVQSDFGVRVLPSVRVDDLAFAEPDRLATRLDAFEQLGGRLGDHAVGDFDAQSLRVFGREYGRRGWTMQLHFGAHRQTSTRLRALAGPAGGYASIGTACDVPGLCRFLDDLEKEGRLPRIILYGLNPADYAALAVLTGSFAEDGVRGKIQFGPAWWYNDHLMGMRLHLETAASYGLLACFIGMTTDSRSLLSLTRHEYFRRVLCNFIGERVASGEWPDDPAMLRGLVRAICYENPRNWILAG